MSSRNSPRKTCPRGNGERGVGKEVFTQEHDNSVLVVHKYRVNR